MNGAHNGAGSMTVTPGMQSAINAGVFAPGNMVTPQCLTEMREDLRLKPQKLGARAQWDGNCHVAQPLQRMVVL